MIKRNDFQKIIKIMSFWKIDKRRGNYRLPSGARLSAYLEELTKKFLKNNGLAIAENGNIYEIVGGRIFKPFSDDESISAEEQEKRIKRIIFETI